MLVQWKRQSELVENADGAEWCVGGRALATMPALVVSRCVRKHDAKPIVEGLVRVALAPVFVKPQTVKIIAAELLDDRHGNFPAVVLALGKGTQTPTRCQQAHHLWPNGVHEMHERCRGPGQSAPGKPFSVFSVKAVDRPSHR